jgi:WD40 repeat protein
MLSKKTSTACWHGYKANWRIQMNNYIFNPQFEENIRLSFGVPEPRPEFVDQLYGDILQRAAKKSPKTRPSLRLRPAWIVICAMLSILLIGTLVIGPQKVYAAFLQLFGYIPGVGIVDQSSAIRVLAEPVSVTRDGITITMTSAVLTDERTHLEYRIFGVPGSAYPDREDVMGCIQQPTLRLPDGTQLVMENDFPPIPGTINEAVFIMPCLSNTLPGTTPVNWEIPVRFVPAPADFTVIPVIESIPSQTPTVMPGTPTPTPETIPLLISKVLDIGDQFVLMGEFSYDAALDPSLPAGTWWAIHQISISGADGREIPRSYSNDFDLPQLTRPNGEAWLYQLDKNFVPPVTIRYSGELIRPVGAKEQVELEFDAGENPQDGGQWTINQDFKLGGFNIRLVSISSNSNGYSFHFKADPGASTNAIHVDIVGYTPNCGRGGGGNDFPDEFVSEVCAAIMPGAPEFPAGKLKAILSFQALSRENKSFEVQWSPDTAQMGAFATSTPQPNVCLSSDRLAQIKPLTPEKSNGEILVFEKLDDNENWGLVLYNLDGSRKQVLGSNSSEGALSPDGNQIAYSSADSGIHIIDLTTRVETTLPGLRGVNLHWSYDGKQIAYIGITENAIDSVFVVNVEDKQIRQISDWSYEAVIGWSPDNARLYFVAPYTGGAAWKVFSYDIASGTVEERFTIEDGTAKFLNAKLSPDGNWIAYRGRDNSSLYLVHSDGSDNHLVADNVGIVGVEWSRSGWLGVSLRSANPDETRFVLFNPDGCEAYLLPTTLHGDLEGLFMP